MRTAELLALAAAAVGLVLAARAAVRWRGNQVFDWAVVSGRPVWVGLLLRLGFDPFRPYAHAVSPALHAMQTNTLALIDPVFRGRANRTLTLGEYEITPLQGAMMNWPCRADVVRFLLDQGADPHAEDQVSPLFSACAHRIISGRKGDRAAAAESLRIVRLLLERGAVPTGQNRELVRTFYRRRDEELTALLRSHGV